jgi:hypothetical protein
MRLFLLLSDCRARIFSVLYRSIFWASSNCILLACEMSLRQPFCRNLGPKDCSFEKLDVVKSKFVVFLFLLVVEPRSAV